MAATHQQNPSELSQYQRLTRIFPSGAVDAVLAASVEVVPENCPQESLADLRWRAIGSGIGWHSELGVSECFDSSDDVRELLAFDERHLNVGECFYDLTGPVELCSRTEFTEQVDECVVVEPAV
jgi:hypothetical protein